MDWSNKLAKPRKSDRREKGETPPPPDTHNNNNFEQSKADHAKKNSNIWTSIIALPSWLLNWYHSILAGTGVLTAMPYVWGTTSSSLGLAPSALPHGWYNIFFSHLIFHLYSKHSPTGKKAAKNLSYEALKSNFKTILSYLKEKQNKKEQNKIQKEVYKAVVLTFCHRRKPLICFPTTTNESPHTFSGGQCSTRQMPLPFS